MLGRFGVVVGALGLAISITNPCLAQDAEQEITPQEAESDTGDKAGEVDDSVAPQAIPSVGPGSGLPSPSKADSSRTKNESRDAPRFVDWPWWVLLGDRPAQGIMALATILAVVLSFFATYFLYASLRETRRIGMAQIRAYLADDETRFTWAKIGPIQVENIEISWRNTGQSPAKHCGVSALIFGIAWEEMGNPIPEATKVHQDQELGSLSIAAGRNYLCGGAGLNPEETRDWLQGDNAIVVYSTVKYRDVFGRIHQAETCQQAVHIENPDGNIIRFKVYPYHNSAD